MSKGGFIDVIENADRVVDSHTCFSGVYRHKRNIEDWQIRILVEKNGLIGVTLCGYFSTNEKELPIEKFARQIDYYCQRFPIKNLCLGTFLKKNSFASDTPKKQLKIYFIITYPNFSIKSEFFFF